jgi:hypothetical protein
MTLTERRDVYRSWTAGHTLVVVATIGQCR